MPKASLPSLPLSAVFAIAKPSGPPSMTVVESLKPLIGSSRLFATDAERKQAAKTKGKGKFKKGKPMGPKIGTGGTLDPLADGVLVLGVNEGTKKLGTFLECTKEYRTTCLLGCETDSYDSEGAVSRTAPWAGITRERIEGALERFRGEVVQIPPIFSALKMDGMPLYEYARKGIPLPRPVEGRRVTVHELALEDWQEPGAHSYKFPEKVLSKEEREKAHAAFAKAEVDPVPEGGDELAEVAPGPTFTLRMRVSGGTYVRSIVHDVGRAVGSAAHVVTLTRTRQAAYALEPRPNENADEEEHPTVPWDVFERAIEKRKKGEELERDADGWAEWERVVRDALTMVEERRKDVK
ncbi:pseudouridylate synthase 4 [Auricularia subglabra TFB-10046 SS5]|nr:pseudouridylate synthase 4 [Auricularia subglabra TFB-10046 SS5]